MSAGDSSGKALSRWQTGDVILFRVRSSASLADRTVHRLIQTHQARMGFNARDRAYGHVAIYDGDGHIWHSTRKHGVHRSEAALELPSFDLVAVRWAPDPTVAAAARAAMMRRVINECRDREGKKYARTEVGRLAWAAIKKQMPDAQGIHAEELICSQLIDAAFRAACGSRYVREQNILRALETPMPAHFARSVFFKPVV